METNTNGYKEEVEPPEPQTILICENVISQIEDEWQTELQFQSVIQGSSIHLLYSETEDEYVERQTEFQDYEEIRKRETKQAEEDFEETLDSTLAEGDVDDISDVINPYGLGNCRTNCLEKAMQVSSRLYQHAQQKGPSAEEFRKLADSAQEFAVELIEPLKGDDMKRAIFGSRDDFDRITDKALQYEQKKFVSHPVVYAQLKRRWIGDFWGIRHAPLLSYDWLIWILINIWVPLDLVLFPAVFALLYIIHLAVGFLKRRKDTHVVFLWNASGEFKSDTFERMKDVAKATVKMYGLRGCQVRYSSVMQIGDFVAANDDFTWRDLIRNLIPTTSQDDQQDSDKRNQDYTWLLPALAQASEMFSNDHINTNKVLVILTDSQFWTVKEDLMDIAKDLRTAHVTTVPVGIGVSYNIQELVSIATHPEDMILLPDLVDDEAVGKRLCDIIYGRDCFDHYIKYFCTPRFIFMRDTCSYLVLLALHFAVCLQPSSRQFTATEVCIFVIFLGRLMMEVHQLISSSSSDQDNGYKVRETLIGIQRQKTRKHAQLWRYFNDRWNVLDVITLISYIILLILRVVTWSAHGQVSQNRLLAVVGYLYGLNSMLLTLRVFGHMMESKKSTGTIQIALFQIIGAVVAIFGQFLAATIAFSLAITKIYMVELSYTAATNATSHGFCSKAGVDCWWVAAQHLVWSLLGIADVGPLTSSDAFSESLAKLLYGVFLIMGVVMLMNMMIALLSNTYQQVEDNSFHEWSYKKAITIRTYSGYHPVPVPFNIISFPAMMLYKAIRRACPNICMKRERSQSEDEMVFLPKIDDDPLGYQHTGGPDPIFDRLCKDLKATYESRYGYAFPLTDEGKIDRVVKETQGNYQLVGHIANRVFREDWAEREQGYPTGEQAWDYIGLRINGNQITYLGPEHCSRCAAKRDIHHGARYVRPLTKEFPGFEVLIQECERRFIAVGLVGRNYDKHLFPGWRDTNSVGYHVDDGKVFDHSDPKFGRSVSDVVAHRGDLIGCFAEFDDITDANLPVRFTLNGHVIARASLQYSTFGNNAFYPCVAMAADNISVVVKMCPTVSTPHSTFAKTANFARSRTRYDSTSDDLYRLSRQVENLSLEIMRLRRKHESPSLHRVRRSESI